MSANVDMINQPPHYRRGGYEVIDIIMAFGLDYLIGTVIKYLLRFGHKGTRAEHLADLKKARWFLDKKIQIMQAEEDASPTYVPVAWTFDHDERGTLITYSGNE